MKYKLKKISGDASFREFYRLEKKNKTSIIISAKKEKFKNLIVYGPAPSLIEKKNNQYRYKILIKLIKDFSFQNKIKFYLKNINLPNRARVFIDVDPLNFI